MYRDIYYKLTSYLSFRFRSNFKKIFFNYVASNNNDKKLEKYLNYENGYFVELGANDGINQSNTFYFEKKKNWSGILIEPYKINYLECKKNRSNKNKYFCAACVPKDYKKKKLKLFYANLLTTSDNNLKNMNKIKSNRIHVDRKKNPYYFYARTLTLDNIFKISKSPKIIDLLSLDVEGSELNVLKGINFNKYKFKYMLIECNEYKKIVNFLKTKNYFIEQHFGIHDYLFKFKE